MNLIPRYRILVIAVVFGLFCTAYLYKPYPQTR
jgi:hypothetical protein